MIKMRVDTFLRLTSSKTTDMNGNIALQIFEMCAKFPKVWEIHGQELYSEVLYLKLMLKSICV